ncbi:hypothetical protein [Cellulomonas sp.]|nr:hypothetical protein [Cellulomonas sp.]
MAQRTAVTAQLRLRDAEPAGMRASVRAAPGAVARQVLASAAMPTAPV